LYQIRKYQRGVLGWSNSSNLELYVISNCFEAFDSNSYLSDKFST
jgi:hypothetical protein